MYDQHKHILFYAYYNLFNRFNVTFVKKKKLNVTCDPRFG